MGRRSEQLNTWARRAVDLAADHSAPVARAQLARKVDRTGDLWESRFHASLGPGRRAVDVGAHLGVISTLYARRFDEVWAVEPNPDHAARLRRTLPAGVVVAAVACGEEPGRAELAVPRHHGRAVASLGSLVTSAGDAGDVVRHTVPVVRLADLVPGPIDVLKVDAEGFEAEVLRGAGPLLDGGPVVIVESEERHRPGAPAMVRELLEQAGLVGLMPVGGEVLPVSRFDPAVHQANPPGLLDDDPGDYVEQFVFVPAGEVDRWADRLARALR